MMFEKKELKSSGTTITRGKTLEQQMVGKSPDPSALTFNFGPRGGWSGRAISAVLTGLFCVGSGMFPWFLWGPEMTASLSRADYALEKAPAIAITALLLVYSIWVISAGIRAIICITWAEDQLALDQEALWLLQKRGPLVSSLTIPRKNIRSLFIKPTNSMIMIVLKSNLIPLTSFGTHAEQNQAVVQLCKALALPDNSSSVVHECLPSSWLETDGPNGERLVIQNPKSRRRQTLILAILTTMVWLGFMLLCRERQSEPNLMVVELGLAVFGSWLVRKMIWMFRGRDEWRIEPGKLIHQRRFASTATELAEARAVELSGPHVPFLSEDNTKFYHLKAVSLAALPFGASRIRPKRSILIQSSSDLNESRHLAQWLSQQAAIPLHDKVLNHRR